MIHPRVQARYARIVDGIIEGAAHAEERVLRQTRSVLEVYAERLRGRIQAASEDWEILDATSLRNSLLALNEELGQVLGDTLEEALDRELRRQLIQHGKWGELLGIDALAGPAVPGNLAIAAANTSTTLVQGLTQQNMVGLVGELQAASLGGISFSDAVKAVRPYLGSNAGPFGSVWTRAAAIVKTEMHRAFAIADEITYKRLDENVPGTRYIWKRTWALEPRETHIAAEADSIANPRKPGELFNVGGYQAAFPHDPRLPAKESVHCSCRKLPTFEEIDWKAIADRAEASGKKVPGEQGPTASELPAAEPVTAAQRKKAIQSFRVRSNAPEFRRYVDDDIDPKRWFDSWSEGSGNPPMTFQEAIAATRDDYLGNGLRSTRYLPARLEDAVLDALDRQARDAGIDPGRLLTKTGKPLSRFKKQESVERVQTYIQNELRVVESIDLDGMTVEAANEASRAIYDVVTRTGRDPIRLVVAYADGKHGSGVFAEAGVAPSLAATRNPRGILRFHPDSWDQEQMNATLASVDARIAKLAKIDGPEELRQLRERLTLLERSLDTATTDSARSRLEGLVSGTRQQIEDAEAMLEAIQRRPFHGQGRGTYGLTVHELGHIMHAREGGGRFEFGFDSVFGKAFSAGGAIPREGRAMARRVSEYALSNYAELIAESWAAFHRGDFDVIDPKVLRILRILAGGH